ncbi:MFS general substrate transporter [Cryphonectria parasitica EP155]|uniref:MFS general substrate transporter n=1 Tax=Cryphonectria parasitica (strain ATCC 38755 / EP155) TaxID=660469 RepID=A0A9P4Y3K6_CRYP1|nr:MFS general substrate transporter [Cryphonectria parasitica EP155]KAF3765884.1 MFS general substrate transporter [Cryphonectria parasitica EP155]
MANDSNEIDREILAAEQDAARDYNRRASTEVERVVSASSVSTSTSGGSLRERHGMMSRMSTQRDLERHPTELDRIQTARSQHSATVGVSMGRSNTNTRDSRRPMPPMGGGKSLPPKLNVDDYVVEFDGPDDPLHAQNWPLRKKILTAAMLGFTTLTAAFTSSIFSAGTQIIAAEFGVSTEVGILGVSFYVLGFATGPSLWAPFSELKGRRLPLVISMFGFSIFTISCAVAKDLQTILIVRFFAGFTGACPLAVVAAVFSDMFNNATRGIAITIFSMMVFTGPLLAPFIGGFIVESYLGWRWTMYITSFMGFLSFGLDLIFLEETYPPQILVAKAAELRRRTKNHFIHAKQEEIEVDFRELVEKNLSRPMRILFQEPIVLLLSIYMSFIYGILYLFLTAYPLVFEGVHHFSPGVAGLAFFGMIIGELIAGLVVLAQQPWYQRKLAANNGIPIPEWRLPSVMAGGLAFAIGLFWFGWSGYRADIHWIVPTASGLLTGFGLMSIFLQALNYLVDAYLMFAASAIAGNTAMRSLCGAGFPLFSTYMFEGMGIQWASTLLGCVGVALVPIPVIFYLYGHKLRAKSKIAPTFPSQKDERGDGQGALASAAPKKESDKATEAV